MKYVSFTSCLTFILGLAFCIHSALPAEEILESPSGKVAVSVDFQDGLPRWSVTYARQPVIVRGRLGLVLKEDAVKERTYDLVATERFQDNTTWKPVVGPINVIRDHYQGLVLKLKERAPGTRQLEILLRAYDEGVACRYRLPEQEGLNKATVDARLTEFAFTQDHTIYQERGYSYGTTRINTMLRSESCVTVELDDGAFATLTDADRCDFPQAIWQHRKDVSGSVVSSFEGPAVSDVSLPITTSWEVMILGSNLSSLRGNRHLVQNLNPPCALPDVSWIRQENKAICQVYNAKMTNPDLKKLLAFASANNIPYMEIDHSWSGAETKWSEAEIDNFDKKKEKFWNDHPEWRDNVKGGLMAPAKGYVPFRPTSYAGGNLVDLDIPALVAYANSLTPKVGICLYVRCALLKEFGGEHAIDDVFKTYRDWGIAGVKPGFVPSGSQKNERIIASMVKKAAEHQLIAVIHDAWVPYGLERTYPNLLNVEGVAGEEAEPGIPAPMKSLHDVMLPFTRGMMGPFDYTPQFYKKSKTQCHQLSMIGVYDGRSSIRAGMAAWSPGGSGGTEIEFIRRYPGLFDSERTFAKLGKYVIVARRSGTSWYIAGMSGPDDAKPSIALDFLDHRHQYTATIYHDVPGSLKAEREVRQVDAKTNLTMAMEANGGQVMILDPIDGDTKGN